MPHYMYEDRPTGKAIIHLDSCGHYNHGRGTGLVARHSQWHGPLQHARECSAPGGDPAAVLHAGLLLVHALEATVTNLYVHSGCRPYTATTAARGARGVPGLLRAAPIVADGSVCPVAEESPCECRGSPGRPPVTPVPRSKGSP